jgi:hypothetical protein
MIYLIVNSIVSGLIIFLIFDMIFKKFTNSKKLNTIKKPFGVRLSFFVTGIIIYLLSYYLKFD